MIKIKLTEKERELLEKAVKENDIQPSYNIIPTNLDFIYVEATEDNLIDLRECCSDYLPLVGFDKDYNPTAEGLILENLIDKFYMG